MTMADDSNHEPSTVTLKVPMTALLLGLPAVPLWVIGGFGALGLMSGLSTGSVTPGVGSSATSLFMMWGIVMACAAGGVFLGVYSFYRPVRKIYLATNSVFAFFSLFFSILAY